MADWDDVLGDLDRPRPLTPGLRGRLEQRLTADDVAVTMAALDEPLALSPELRARLEGTLVRTRRSHVAGWGAAAAAVVGLVAAAALLTSRGPAPTTTARPAGVPPSAGETVGDGLVQPGSGTGAVGGVGTTPGAAPAPVVGGPAQSPTPASDPAADRPQPAALAPSALPKPTPPSVSRLDPSSGPFTGGTAVTVTGSGFTADVVVSFGETRAPSVVVVSTTELRVTSPAHLPGQVVVSVANGAGASAPTDGARFRYVA
jgi:hypothetical protein